MSTTTLVHDEVGKYEIAIGQRVARGWGAIATTSKENVCDTTILSSEVASMLKVKFK